MTNSIEPSLRVKEEFQKLYAEKPQGVFCSPGRVNLIGEHTDYNDGFVLPAAINFYTAIAASRRDDMLVEAYALDHQSKVQIDLSKTLIKNPEAPWSDYLAGVLNEFINRGIKLQGMNLVISGNIPQGAGLSSSASLEVAIALAVNELNELSIDGEEAALIGQAAENNFAGCQCGIMDQLASSLGKRGQAMLLDCRSLATKYYPIPENLRLIVINSKVQRGLVGSEYNTRRKQCEEAAGFFGVTALRDLGLEELETGKSGLSEVVYRRARHIVTENVRTQNAALALANNNIESLSKLMGESHISMRDDFEITVEPVDTLVSIVSEVLEGKGGVRMTGGGFGGCVIAIVPVELEQHVCEAVRSKYKKLTGIKESIYVCETSNGGFHA